MFRLELAIAIARENGRKVRKSDIAKKLWPDSSRAAQRVNISGLCNGNRLKVNPEWVKIICDELGCSADFLFGISDK